MRIIPIARCRVCDGATRSRRRRRPARCRSLTIGRCATSSGATSRRGRRAIAKAVAALFTADADQLVSSGEWRQGREQVVTGSLASSAQSGGKRTIDVERVRLVSKDVAIADGRYAITGGEGGDRRMWSTFVMVKEAGGWRIAAIRNMLPAPPASSPPK